MTDAPRVQYVKASDGVNIAYGTAGTGPPVVWIMNPFQSHLQLAWEQPPIRAGFDNIVGGGATLVRFDPRGSGLSDRDVEVSVAGYVRDLEAVVDHLQLDKFSLLTIEWGSATAIPYAALHPDRVSRLLMMNPAWGGVWQTPRGQRWFELQDDWEMLTETVAAMAFGFGYEQSHQYAAFMRASIEHDTFKRWMSQEVDLTAVARDVQAPTLVIRHSGVSWLTMESTRTLVSAIPNCEMISVEGTYLDHPGRTGRIVREFLGLQSQRSQRVRAASAAPAAAPAALRTVLFTDLVGHTEMMSRLGDEKGRDVLREHERITRQVLKANGGTEVKTMGDGFMASFGSVTKAVECAIALQRAFADREGEPLSVRVGLNAGEPIEEDGDLFGATVILASRIAAKADGGEILVADTVRGLCSGKGFLFADRGDFVAKGIQEPVRISEVSWRE